jgi:hypothetical protein
LGPTSGSSNIGLIFLAEGEMATDATGVERGCDQIFRPNKWIKQYWLGLFSRGRNGKGCNRGGERVARGVKQGCDQILPST